MVLNHFIGYHAGDLHRQFFEFTQKVDTMFRTTEDRTYNVIVTRSMRHACHPIELLDNAYGWETCFNVQGVQINVYREATDFHTGVATKSLICKVDHLKFKTHVGETDNKRIEEELIQPFYKAIMKFVDIYHKKYGLDHDGIYQVSPVQAV